MQGRVGASLLLTSPLLSIEGQRWQGAPRLRRYIPVPLQLPHRQLSKAADDVQGACDAARRRMLLSNSQPVVDACMLAVRMQACSAPAGKLRGRVSMTPRLPSTCPSLETFSAAVVAAG
jgi:hypothetical protein